MPAVTGPALAVAALLVLAGSQKLLDPTMTVGALRALRLPASPLLVRAGSAAELVLGAVAIAVGGPVLWALVAASYLAFAAFVAAALRSGTPIGTCGCFGREETPPHPSHVALNVAVAVVAVAAAATTSGPLVDGLFDDVGTGVALVVSATVTVGLLYAAFVELPRAAAAAHQQRL